MSPRVRTGKVRVNAVSPRDSACVHLGPKMVFDLRRQMLYPTELRAQPNETYFARLRVCGKLIRRSLKTTVLSVAKLRLGDLENKEQLASRQTEWMAFETLLPGTPGCQAALCKCTESS